MKNTIAKTVGFAWLTLILFIAAAQTSVMGQEETGEAQQVSGSSQNQLLNRIIGVWETTVTPRNCQTGEPAGPAFIGLITFHKGGTLSEYGANPATPFRTPGHGVWQAAPWRGEDSYLMNFTFIPLTPAGAPVGRLKVTQTIEYQRYLDQLLSSGSFQLFNTSGVVIASGCTSSIAIRFR